MAKVMCPYCNFETRLVSGKEVYPHRKDLYKLKFFKCPVKGCGAYTGTHEKTLKPKGSPARDQLRRLRQRVHGEFDQLWKSLNLRRSVAYRWLSEECDWIDGEVHIGFMLEEDCVRALPIVREMVRRRLYDDFDPTVLWDPKVRTNDKLNRRVERILEGTKRMLGCSSQD